MGMPKTTLILSRLIFTDLYIDCSDFYVVNCDIHLNKLINKHFTNSFFLTKKPIILKEFLT